MLDIARKKLGPFVINELKKFAKRVNKFGFNFAVCDPCGELIIWSSGNRFESDKAEIASISIESISQGKEGIFKAGKEEEILTAILKEDGQIVGTALIDTGLSMSEETSVLVNDCLCEMLSLLLDVFQQNCQADKQIEEVGSELAQTYEELMLLYKLNTSMKVTETDSNFLQIACDSVTDIISVEGIAVFIEKVMQGESRLVLTAGRGLVDIDECVVYTLRQRLEEELKNGKEALLDGQVGCRLKYEWPSHIKNILAVPMYGKEKADEHTSGQPQISHEIIGIMVAINRIGKEDFNSIDAKLFNSVANSSAVFVENEMLFGDLKELFIGLLRALTNSIDAKDQYTRGHSERVAFISRWVAERYISENGPLDEKQIHRIYLAGLLHDIGKIGINEAVLRKNGKLTEKEMSCIRMHPLIGANILYGIKQMHDIVPGVLYHHERVDGRGYPEGLIDDKIPLIGKIIGLADSFDAMTSGRVYRKAMSLEKALSEILAGLGTQFDEKVGKTFLDSDVAKLWTILQEGADEVFVTNGLSNYDTVAVETLIR